MAGSPAQFRAPQALPINAGLSRRRSSHARKHPAELARPGVYGRLPAWWGRESWCRRAVPAALAHRRGELARHYPVADDTTLRIAKHLASAADHRTGRQARPTIAALMAEADNCERTVQYALALLEALGLVVRVVQGRSAMTRAERLWAWRHGSSARAIAAEFACVVPAAVARVIHKLGPDPVDGCTPPGVAVGSGVKSPREGGSSRAEGPRRSRPGGRHPPRSTGPALTSARARHHRLVAELQDRMSWVSRVPPRRLTSLHRFAVHGWSGRDVQAALEALMRDRGWQLPAQIVNPPAYLAMLLRGLEPTDRAGDVDELLDARSPRQLRNELAAWRNTGRVGTECPHGQPGGDVPHPIDGYKACPFCRKDTTDDD